jgi:hypothetical protein
MNPSTFREPVALSAEHIADLRLASASLTGARRHQGQDSIILSQRQAVYEQARMRHPERWSGPIRNWQPITEVWLNPSAEVIDTPAEGSQIK